MRVLGLRPVLGRAFADGDDKPGGPPVAMISEALWRRRFGADPAIVGQSAMVNSTFVVGRFRAGVSQQEAQAAMDTVAASRHSPARW